MNGVPKRKRLHVATSHNLGLDRCCAGSTAALRSPPLFHPDSPTAFQIFRNDPFLSVVADNADPTHDAARDMWEVMRRLQRRST